MTVEAGEEAEEPRTYRTPWRAFRRFAGALVKRPLLWLAFTVLPEIYLLYMRFVWWTSRVEDELELLQEVRRRHDGAVCLLWHEEVFSVAWSYRRLHGHTLASLGDAGEAITRLLQRCNYTVFRGGSAHRVRSKRRRPEVVNDMIEHMKTTPMVLYGLTVDGSQGPRYRLKRGAVVIARECGKPLCVVKTWAKRNIRLPTWDRMAIPLPFNHIRQTCRGPFFVPEDAQDPEKLEAFRRRMERELAELTEEHYRFFGHRIPADLYAD